MSPWVSFVLVVDWLVLSLVSSAGVANNNGDFIFAADLNEDDDGCVTVGATAIKAFDVHDVAASNSNSNSIKVA
jgi:hypothetical protein